MREWIKLIERAQTEGGLQGAQWVLEKLKQHVGVGRLEDADYQKMMGLVPRPQSPMTLYRVEPMSVSDIAQLKTGISRPMPHQFYFWTTDIAELKYIAHEVAGMFRDNREKFGNEDFKLILMQRVFKPDEIVLDVNGFNRWLRRETGQRNKVLDQYSHENEVIVLEKQRVLNSKNTRVLKDSLVDRVKQLLGMPVLSTPKID